MVSVMTNEVGEPNSRGPKLLRDALAARDWSGLHLEEELRKLLGVVVAQGISSKWTTGKRVPGLAYALGIERLLNVPATVWVPALDNVDEPPLEAATGTTG